ncbi:3-keto-disaccharide hydrolase [Gemmatimonas phototrophica]|uniref:3-keto-disaccharide hydrolase n=1 Tax=Gemmatimonas phototrophica TaxID=1379270 RepID=UPI0006A70555|nr:DUF1080 domain-containing protein [Gemmatimonas phototrophica]
MMPFSPGRPRPGVTFRRAFVPLLLAAISAVSLAAPALNAQPKPGPWTPLFDGRSLAGWHNYDTPGQPVAGWSVENGILIRSGAGGDLTTDKQFGNFELELDWKVEKGGNSGVIYRIDHSGEKTYVSGPEMQILDDAVHRDGQNPLTSAGANYALHAAPRGVVKGPGEWNQVRLVVHGTHVEHWLNGQKMVEYELGSADWEARRKASKFAGADRYGRATRGHIALQDHGDRVYFRNVRIRELL